MNLLISQLSHLAYPGLIEIDHLVDLLGVNLPQDLLERDVILVRTQVDFDMGQCADYGLVLGLIDALEWPQNGQDIVVLLVLLDRLHARIVVLLIA